MNLENSWQEPRITENKSEQFPIESMPHYLADLVQALALEVQVPIELPYFAAMSLLATATSGSIEVLVKGRHTEQLSFYSIIALGSGNRKSEVIKTLKAPHLAFEKDRCFGDELLRVDEVDVCGLILPCLHSLLCPQVGDSEPLRQVPASNLSRPSDRADSQRGDDERTSAFAGLHQAIERS